jgi:hypothetical protein
MFTSLFVCGSAVIGGYQIIACATKGLATGATALLQGKGIKTAVHELALDLSAPVAAIPFATREMLASLNTLGSESWDTAGRLLASMKRPVPQVVPPVVETVFDPSKVRAVPAAPKGTCWKCNRTQLDTVLIREENETEDEFRECWSCYLELNQDVPEEEVFEKWVRAVKREEEIAARRAQDTAVLEHQESELAAA